MFFWVKLFLANCFVQEKMPDRVLIDAGQISELDHPHYFYEVLRFL